MSALEGGLCRLRFPFWVDASPTAVIDPFRVFLCQRVEVIAGEPFGGCKSLQLVAKVLIEDESKDVILVFVGFDLRAHLVSGFPDLGCELLLVHDSFFLVIYGVMNRHEYREGYVCLG